MNMPPMHPFCRCKVTTPEESLEDIEREIDERIKSWNIPEGMSLDEFIDRVNNGELEQIRAEQEKSAQKTVDNSENRGIIEVGKEDIKGRSSGTGEEFVESWFEHTGQIDVSSEEQVNKTLSDFEQKYEHSNKEHCVVITETGAVYEVHGGKWNVDTTVLGGRMSNSINEHNHVTGESQYSFSKEDISESAKDGSKVALAFDEKYKYSMTFESRISSSDINDAYDDATMSVLNRKFYGELISDEDEQHEIVKMTCETLGIKYERWFK